MTALERVDLQLARLRVAIAVAERELARQTWQPAGDGSYEVKSMSIPGRIVSVSAGPMDADGRARLEREVMTELPRRIAGLANRLRGIGPEHLELLVATARVADLIAQTKLGYLLHKEKNA
jgi:hypothetical protein